MVYPSDDHELRTRLLARQLTELRARLHDQVQRLEDARAAMLARHGPLGEDAAARGEAGETGPWPFPRP